MPTFDATFVGKLTIPDGELPIVPPEPIPPNPPQPGDKALITAADLEYLGSYVADNTNESLNNLSNYSWGVPAFRYIGGVKHMYLRGPSEKINGWPEWPSLALWRVPVPTKGTPAVCGLVRSWRQHIAGGAIGTYDTGRMQAYGEAAIMYPIHWNEDLGMLMWCYSGIYNGNYSNPVLGYTRLNDDGTLQAYGPWRASVHSKKVNSAIVQIPDWFRPNVGGAKWALGGKNHTQIAGGNVGAGLHVIQDLPDPGAPPNYVYPDQTPGFHCTSLIDYDDQNPQPRAAAADYDLCNWACALPGAPSGCQGIYDSNFGGPVSPGMPYFSGSKPAAASCVDWLDGICWIETETKRGLLYCGQANLTPAGQSRRHNWYGARTCAHGQTDASWEATGPGGGYVGLIGQIFNPSALIAVSKRTRSPRDVGTPEEFLWNTICSELPAQAGATSTLSACTFDPVDKTVTVALRVAQAVGCCTIIPRWFVFRVKD